MSPPADVRLPSAWLPGGQAESPLPDAKQGPGRLAGVGSGFAAYPELRGNLALDLILEGLLPSAGEVAQLAALEVAAGRILPPEQALPVYLRDDVARPQ